MKNISKKELFEFLEEKYNQYNNTSFFINSDPISIPHLFSKKEDIEIASFLTATIAWGQRVSIIKNARRLLLLMDDDPYQFILNAQKKDLFLFEKFVHRTFNGIDCMYFISALSHIYKNKGGLELLFSKHYSDTKQNIISFRSAFFEMKHPSRTEKHISDPSANSAAKRINMFLRWMVRKDKSGVDFGIWEKISSQNLYCPLDVHSGRVARKLGLLNRPQNDWKAVDELTNSLKKFDFKDPVKYDFALFGLGVFEKF